MFLKRSPESPRYLKPLIGEMKREKHDIVPRLNSFVPMLVVSLAGLI